MANTEKILLHSDGLTLTALFAVGNMAEHDFDHGLSDNGMTWEEALGDNPGSGFWVFEGFVTSGYNAAEHVDEGPEYQGDFREATEEEVIAVVKGEQIWPSLGGCKCNEPVADDNDRVAKPGEFSAFDEKGEA